MKKFLSVFASIVLLLSLCFPSTVFAEENISTVNAFFTQKTGDGDIFYTVGYTAADAVQYENARTEAYIKLSEKYSDEEIAASSYSWVLYPLEIVLYADIDGSPCFIKAAKTDVTEISLSLFNDIIPALSGCSGFERLCDGFDFCFLLTLAFNINGEYKGSDSFGYAESEPCSVPPFCYIEYLTPENTDLNGNPSGLFAPVENDIILNLPTLPGHIFTGFTDSSGEALDRIKAGTKHLIITVNWKVKTFSLRTVLTTRTGYSFIYCPSNNPTEFTADETITLNAPYVPSGWVFAGWYTDADFTGEPVEIIPAGTAEDVVLYAKWQTEQEAIDEKIKNEHWGDLDSDGKVTASDARLALRSSVGLEQFSSDITARADFAGTGRLSASDARNLLRIAVGIDSLEDILRVYKII